MNVEDPDLVISRIAAAVGEPARVRMLYCLLDGHARTSTELAVVADVRPSTASSHLNRLLRERLIKVIAQGKHRYYSLDGANVADALEALSVVAGTQEKFVPNTSHELREARTCYDHAAGRLGVMLHNHFKTLGWLSEDSTLGRPAYVLTRKGSKAIEALGIDLAAARVLRRRFAYPCLDWSERQPHIGGALGAALLKILLKRKWLTEELDSRVLIVTHLGQKEMLKQFHLKL